MLRLHEYWIKLTGPTANNVPQDLLELGKDGHV